MKILLIDDSLIIRKITNKCLMDIGYKNIIQAIDGKDALQKVAENPDIGLVLCDWNMPEMNGFEFLIEFRKDTGHKNVPFIMVTTESEKESIAKVMQAGANNYVIKPFEQEDLQEKIEQTLKGMNAEH